MTSSDTQPPSGASLFQLEIGRSLSAFAPMIVLNAMFGSVGLVLGGMVFGLLYVPVGFLMYAPPSLGPTRVHPSTAKNCLIAASGGAIGTAMAIALWIVLLPGLLSHEIELVQVLAGVSVASGLSPLIVPRMYELRRLGLEQRKSK